jgi:UDP-glucose 4-epimerase
MRHTCVIGGAGFIGRHLVEILLARGRVITVVGRSTVPSRPLPKEVRYVSGDYGDATFLREVLKDVHEIINLAYTTVPGTSFNDPVQDILHNLPPAVRLLEVANDLAIQKIVLISSGGTVYGQALHLPISEDHATNPISPYGVTKLAIEKYGLLFHKVKSLPVVIVRPSNAFGEWQRPFAGQGLVATAAAAIIEQRELVLYGESEIVRDYIYAADVAEGIAAALEHGAPGSCYNIGSGVGRSNKDILDAICALAESSGLRPRFKILPPRGFDVKANVLDSAKLSNETGWKATVPFREGIERTWNWFLSPTCAE